MECFACHHSLTRPQDSWRQERGYPDRQPGATAWNASRYIVFRNVALAVNRDLGGRLDAELSKLTEQVGKWSNHDEDRAQTRNRPRRSPISRAAAEQTGYDQALTQRVMVAIVSDGTNIANNGERSAEQAAMALDSLDVALCEESAARRARSCRSSIDGLFKQLNNPSAYNAPQFAAQLQKVRAQLPSGRVGKSGSH